MSGKIRKPSVSTTPSPGGPVPIPYPVMSEARGNAAMAEQVKLAGKDASVSKESQAGGSTLNEDGMLHGMMSNTNSTAGTVVAPSQTKVVVN